MIRFIDGCDHYGTADLNSKWNNSSGVVVSSGTGRFGGGSLRLADLASGSFVQKTLDPQASWVVGVGLQPSGFPAASAPVIRLLDQGLQQVELRLNPDGTLTVTRNGVALSGGTSLSALRTGTYYYLELKATISTAIAAGSCKVQVNGQTVITVATGQSTQSTANATANSVAFHGVAANSQLDDFYVCDGQGSANVDFLGDCRVVTLLPNAAGDKSQWALTGTGLTGNFQAVGVNPPAGDTAYVSSATVGNTDLYNFADLSLAGTVFGVQFSLYARKDDAGVRTLANVVKSGGAEYTGPTFYPGLGYLFYTDVRETDPATGAAWTPTGVTNVQSGPKIIS